MTMNGTGGRILTDTGAVSFGPWTIQDGVREGLKWTCRDLAGVVRGVVTGVVFECGGGFVHSLTKTRVSGIGNGSGGELASYVRAG